MSKNKKIIIGVVISIVIIGLVIGGILLLNNITRQKREQEFKTAAREYYDKHMASIYGKDEAIITLKAINNAITNTNEKYNIKSLKKCSLDSTITFYVTNQKITNEKIELICK